MEKTFYKSLFFWLISLFVVIFIATIASNEVEVVTNVKEQTQDKKQASSNNPKDMIKNEAESIAKELMSTSINKIEVNKNVSSNNPNDYDLVLHLSFDAKNTKKTTKKMLETYNNEIGARVGKVLNKVQELTIFWEVPFIQKGTNIVKANLKRSEDNMLFKDTWVASVLK
ncbi:hypothetical protein [Bacillus sp. NPDC094077]|uniref:hypothetical protein n=1 Tax=Bacillus sp. NPDC094077 TaxID=3390932 RepID=UPI003D04AC6A